MKRVAAVAALSAVALLLAACGGGQSNSTPPPPPQLTIVTATIPDATVGASYTFTLQAGNASGAVTWSVASGNLPSGLTLAAATGVISGTPTTAGSYNYTVQAAAGNQTAQKAFTHRINGLLAITTTALPDAPFNQVYSQQLQASGGVAPYTWSVPSPTALPEGLVLAANGTLSGIPFQVISLPVSFTVMDSSTPALSAVAVLNVTIPQPPLTILTSSLPPARVGVPYAAVFYSTPYVGYLQWTSSNLPAGMQLNATTARLDWTPSSIGTYQFTVHVADGNNASISADRTLSVTVVNTSAAGRNDTIATATPLGMGRFRASISPYADLNGAAAPDQDYYQVTALAGGTIVVETFAARLIDVQSELDTVIEILGANGNRYTSCRDPIDDTASSLPIAVDATPSAYDDGCINDDLQSGVTDSQLVFRVPGTLGQPVTFYVHMLDWSGSARPDFIYDISVGGTGIQ